MLKRWAELYTTILLRIQVFSHLSDDLDGIWVALMFNDFDDVAHQLDEIDFLASLGGA